MPYKKIYFAKSLIEGYDGNMLSYMNSGRRDYHRTPIPTYSRGAWEIQAVLKGTIAPVFPGGSAPRFREQALWAFPPASRHGWAGHRDSPAEILVFHFSHISKELAELVSREESLCLPLEEGDKDLLRGLYDDLYREYCSIGPLYALKSRICADRLALLFCSRFGALPGSPGRSEQNIVDNAVALFSSEMEYGISLEEICGRIGISAAHLRRLFHKVRGGSPRETFEEIRMKRARELCSFTSYSLSEIARACGYAEHSSFTKAYVRYWKLPPSRIRNTGIPD